jgi:hypothetical protein
VPAAAAAEAAVAERDRAQHRANPSRTPLQKALAALTRFDLSKA